MAAGRIPRPGDSRRAGRGGERDGDDGPGAHVATPLDDVAAPDGRDAHDAHAHVIRDLRWGPRRP